MVMHQQKKYRERAKQEEGQQDLIIRQLNRRFGEIDSALVERIRELSIEQLEGLGEALLDFSVVADLETWLNEQAA
ncbi:MAG: DUF4351 domain-containing protein [Goleter apudmare HA4340-LM2]|jgi:predicted transposase YdaD|nr:DUF4351 domain-containing protein [Goleter apudmare HA4340-LM2]